MNDDTQKQPGEDGDMLTSVRRARRHSLWEAQGEPSVVRFVGQIGVLGWIIVTPMLTGLFIGRWIDARLNSGIFWSAPLMLIGVVIGCWSAWRWMHRQ
ncbi:MAG: AtpZ/AtpI family protein [Methylovirgula sp.]